MKKTYKKIIHQKNQNTLYYILFYNTFNIMKIKYNILNK